MIDTISYIEEKDLADGGVRERFEAGSQVVCLRDDPRVLRICDTILLNADASLEFWDESIFAMARNHIVGDTEFGDVFRFAPGQFGHLARKIGFYPDPTGERFIVYPEYQDENTKFGGERQEILGDIWRLALEIQQSAVSVPIDPSRYAAKLEILKYPDSGQQLKRILALVADSTGRLGRLGLKLDAAASTAGGPFCGRYTSYCYAVMSLLPGIGNFIRKFNRQFLDSSYTSVPNDELLVGPPHIDGSRYITMLTGIRDVMKTEVFAKEVWVPIPVDRTSLSIFPTKIFKNEVDGVAGTVHRYTIKEQEASESNNAQNVTILMGLIPRSEIDKSRETVFRGHNLDRKGQKH